MSKTYISSYDIQNLMSDIEEEFNLNSECIWAKLG